MELDPEGSPIALFGRGRARYFLRQYEEAIASLNAFLNRIPTFPAAHEVLAQVYAETGQQAKAEQAIEELLRIKPGHSLARVQAREPYRDPENLERVVNALREAGLPED
jgi:adenylate cyclase